MSYEAVLSKVKNLPPSLQILPKLLRLLQSEVSDREDIIELINVDPALTAQVLKRSNSAYYGTTAPNYNLDDAVNKIGFREVYRLVAIVCSENLLSITVPTYYIDGNQLWEHFLASGYVTEKLATELGRNASSAYTTGLLHAIGKIVINQTHTEEYETVFAKVEGSSRDLVNVEYEVFGFSHADIGAALLEQWGFSDEICTPIKFQFRPLDARRNRQSACMIHLANWIVASVGFLSPIHTSAFKADPRTIDELGISVGQLDGFLTQSYGQLDQVKSFLMAS